ncbi:hypothetical protein [Sphingomonas sp.]|uniref:hypothetical protein n=1 Tax=Sphingomonas sp. TaxID=28214 RepID=UPI00289ACF37|nr:hypothetical protein [Sphingomonas sp.]
MVDAKLTHLQRRRLVQLERLDQHIWRGPAGEWITSHWNSSKAANQKLCDLGLAERYGQTFFQPSGKQASAGDVRITQAGREWLLSARLNKEQAA